MMICGRLHSRASSTRTIIREFFSRGPDDYPRRHPAVRPFHARIVRWGDCGRDDDDDDDDDDDNDNEPAGRRRSRRLRRASRLVSFADVFAIPMKTRGIVVGDATPCADALGHLRRGYALVYDSGDYNNARQLHRALRNRIDRTRKKTTAGTKKSGGDGKGIDRRGDEDDVATTRTRWTRLVRGRRERSDLLRRLLIRLSIDGDDDNEGEGKRAAPSGILGLKRAPANAREILSYAFRNERDEGWRTNDVVLVDNDNDDEDDDDVVVEPSEILISLSEFMGMAGGYEWHRRGVYVEALGGFVRPHFGVFPPTRRDYVGLLDNISVDGGGMRGDGDGDGGIERTMLEVGIGTGILSMIMLRRGVVDRVVGTDINPRAVACAMDNARQFDLDDQMDIVLADLFPPDYRQSSSTTTIEGGKGFDVVLFNPPWMPGDAPTMFDSAVHDPDRMLLRRFVSRAHRYVNRNGHVYIILSNLGALLGLFEERDLHAMFEEGNLELVEVYETKSKGSRAAGNPEDDSWHITDGITNARAREVISLYKLSVKKR